MARTARSALLIGALVVSGSCTDRRPSANGPAVSADAGAGAGEGASAAGPTTTRGKPAVAAVKKTDDGVTIPSDLLFAFDSASLSPAAEDVLPAALDLAVRFPKATLAIDGFTDSIGGAQYNADLSRRRAESVAAWLQARGVSAERLTVRGFGDQRPVADNGTPEGRQINRRVEITVRSKT